MPGYIYAWLHYAWLHSCLATSLTLQLCLEENDAIPDALEDSKSRAAHGFSQLRTVLYVLPMHPTHTHLLFASNVVFCRLHLATERVFPNFSVYGSDSVFQVSPNAPQYTDSGSYLKTKRMVSSCNLF